MTNWIRPSGFMNHKLWSGDGKITKSEMLEIVKGTN